MKEDIKLELQRKYPFMQKEGQRVEGFNKKEMLGKYKNERLLVVMCAVEGAGKTTFCKNNFADYRVWNLDELLAEYLARHKCQFSLKVNEAINNEFFDGLRRNLKRKKVAIADCAAQDISFRIALLDLLKDDYDKVVLIVLNPKFEKIKENILKDIERRARPGLWEDVAKQFAMLQYQIDNKILFWGVDEVYML